MTDPDTDLTAWQRDGDRVALERAVQALLPVGQAIANRILEPSAADDAVQSAVVRMLRALPRYRRTGAGAVAWFAAIVANECRTHLRRERAIHERHRRAAPPTAPDAEPDLEMVRAALAAIPDHERSAVALHHMAGRTVAETARALGCAERTARSWIGSGLQRLRRRLGAAGILLLAGVAAQGAEPSAATRAAVDDRVAAARPPGTRGIAIAGAAAAALAAAGIVLLLLMGGPEPDGAPPAEPDRAAKPGTASAAAAVA
ncbi:MAG: hypothetical protein RLZZ127_3284, partial [Planctomycetota bacterium]